MDVSRRTFRMPVLSAMSLLLVAPTAALGVKVGDITHLQGSRMNRLSGFGLVIGLKGTGDGGKYVPAMRALAQAHRGYANPIVSLEELAAAKNVALVQVEATLPRDGAREGEAIDVQVSSVGAAKSLDGGRLMITPLVGPHPDDPRGVMALASGPLVIENADVPTVAKINQGATLEQNWVHNYIALGRDLAIYQTRSQVRPLSWIIPDEPYVTLVIDKPTAEWGVAAAIAQAINEESSIPDASGATTGARVAVAFDPRTVVLRVPPEERANPAPFLARIEELQLFMPFTEARVTIHRKTGTIVITGDVEIAPAVISHKGLSITIMNPKPAPTAENPKLEEREFIPIDPQNKGGAKLADLVEALNQLRVPADEKISIIEDLKRTGKLYATLICED